MKIYTKTGDHGETGLIGGTRVSKTDTRIEAYGTIDELNSFVGLLASQPIMESEKDTLEQIQHRLFVIGSYLATDVAKAKIGNYALITVQDIQLLESEIDRITSKLPELTAFILPGGSMEGSFSHVCRTISRRAERRILEINKTQCIDNNILIYTNRLSDYFFTLSRHATLKQGGKEIFWKVENK
ncbi:MAG: ATP:cob(I)alamin adenosyltransferase [Porphyromonadaceae bacterium CG2_30_38_12]|nr:MAG: ATP:cob(I)alamin adenosyltransferase [Porphyromonadaceae bacterium CG2_30_38_12]